MDVKLYVYDLTKGMARAMSRQFLGIQIDAVYHTSLVFGDIEYFFGAGVQTCRPSASHHGAPMEIVNMGTTSLPLDTILDYLESLKEIYTPESYDLFAHNCNNFSNDFAMFLVGKGIPDHITSLPKRVLETPFGQMLKPQIDASMRSITQAPVPPQDRPASQAHGLARRSTGQINGHASSTFPHPHTQIRLPTLQSGSLKPVAYTKVPPLDKLTAKLGAATKEPAITAMRSFIEHRQKEGPREAPLPDLEMCSAFMRRAPKTLPPDVLFAAYDILRCTVVDPRVSGWYAEDQHHTIESLLDHVKLLPDCPHNLRLVSIYLACNMFTSPLFTKEAFRSLTAPALVQLVTSSLLDTAHTATRVAASWLAFNIATANYRMRREEEREALGEPEQVELAASLVEAMSQEENDEALKALLLAFGYLVYCSPPGSELLDLCKALDAKGTVTTCKGHHEIAKEVASLL